jgi:hypothetical protein
VSHLLQLQDKYGASSLIYALRKALAHKLYGSEYVENILHPDLVIFGSITAIFLDSRLFQR